MNKIHIIKPTIFTHLSINKLTFILSIFLITSPISSAFAVDNADEFRKEIFAEINRSHGDEIKYEALLSWCELQEAAEDIALKGTPLDRAIFDSIVVAGTQNIKAIEFVRKMPENDWITYRSSIYSGLDQYRLGIILGAESTIQAKNDYCESLETEVYEHYKVVSKN